jgi:hypothetical protein
VPMLSLRAGLALDYHFANGMVATLAPFVFSRSNGPKNIDDNIKNIQQIDILVGIGYSL